MPAESVTHPFEKNVPPPEPVYDDYRGPDGKPGLMIRPVKGVKITPENAHRIAEAQKRRIRAYIEPPMSLVTRSKPTALYSRDINRPLCVARAGAKEWIGTEIGIKCVDRERQIVRIFAAADGLPLGRVERIATDDSGNAAVALVRHTDNRIGITRQYASDWKPDQVAVCLYDAKTGRWNELGALPLSELKTQNLPFNSARRLGHNYRVSYHVVLTEKKVIVVPSAARTDGESAFAVYDRATGRTQANAWDEVLRADHPLIVVNALTRQDDTVFLGTDIGLVMYDTLTESWRRALPTQEISQIVVGHRKDGPIIALAVPRGSGNGYSSPSDFRLFSVSSRDKKPGAALGGLPENRSGDGTLTVTHDGVLWMTYADCFYRADPGTTRWTKINDLGEVDTTDKTQMTRHSFDSDWDPFNSRPILPVAPESKIPDDAMIARILIPRRSFPPQRGIESLSGREPMRWMRQRLARWISPPGVKEEAVPLPDMDRPQGARLPERARHFVPDPDDPKMAFGLQGKTLLHLPKSAIPGDEPYPYTGSGMMIRWYKPLSPSAPNVKKYPLYDASTAQVEEGIAAVAISLLPDPAADDALYLITRSGAKHYDGISGVWTDLPVPVDNFPFGERHGLSFAANGKTPILTTWLQPHVMRLNSATKRFEAVPRAGKETTSYGSRGGLWQGAGSYLSGSTSGSGSKRVFKYRPLESDGTPTDDWRTFTSKPDLAELKNKYHEESYMATGDIAWFRYRTGERDAHATIAGYDARTKRWLAPITTPRYDYSTDIYLAETLEGGAVIGIPNAPVSVFRYRPGTEKWEPLASVTVPTAKSEDSFRPVLAPDDAVYAVTARELCEYDTHRQNWMRSALPAPLLTPASNSVTLDQLKVLATRKSIYIGSDEQGLWSMNRSTKKWKMVREPLQWLPESKVVGAYDVSNIAADKHAVWAVGRGMRNNAPLLLRWDRRTKTARFLSEKETGLTLKPTDFFHVVSAGNTVLLWQHSNSAVYRAEPGGTRFTRIGTAALQHAEPAPDTPGIVFLVSTGSLYRYDDRDQRLITFNPKLPVNQLSGGLVVTKSAVYVGSSAGVYRYDRKNEGWSLVPRTESLWVQGVRREGDTLVINTESSMARFSLQ